MADTIIRHRDDENFRNAYNSILRSLFACVKDGETDHNLSLLITALFAFRAKYGDFDFKQELCNEENCGYEVSDTDIEGAKQVLAKIEVTKFLNKHLAIIGRDHRYASKKKESEQAFRLQLLGFEGTYGPFNLPENFSLENKEKAHSLINSQRQFLLDVLTKTRNLLPDVHHPNGWFTEQEQKYINKIYADDLQIQEALAFAIVKRLASSFALPLTKSDKAFQQPNKLFKKVIFTKKFCKNLTEEQIISMAELDKTGEIAKDLLFASDWSYIKRSGKLTQNGIQTLATQYLSVNKTPEDIAKLNAHLKKPSLLNRFIAFLTRSNFYKYANDMAVLNIKNYPGENGLNRKTLIVLSKATKVFAIAYFSANVDEKLAAKFKLFRMKHLNLEKLNEGVKQLNNSYAGVTWQRFEADRAVINRMSAAVAPVSSPGPLSANILDDASEDTLAAYYLNFKTTTDMQDTILNNPALCNKLLFPESTDIQNKIFNKADLYKKLLSTKNKDQLASYYFDDKTTTNMKNFILNDPALCNKLLSTQSQEQARGLLRDEHATIPKLIALFFLADSTRKEELSALFTKLIDTANLGESFGKKMIAWLTLSKTVARTSAATSASTSNTEDQSEDKGQGSRNSPAPGKDS